MLSTTEVESIVRNLEGTEFESSPILELAREVLGLRMKIEIASELAETADDLLASINWDIVGKDHLSIWSCDLLFMILKKWKDTIR